MWCNREHIPWSSKPQKPHPLAVWTFCLWGVTSQKKTFLKREELKWLVSDRGCTEGVWNKMNKDYFKPGLMQSPGKKDKERRTYSSHVLFCFGMPPKISCPDSSGNKGAAENLDEIWLFEAQGNVFSFARVCIKCTWRSWDPKHKPV